jgi:hypothetical protein
MNLKDLQSDNPEIKYHCAKRAIALSEKTPAALYPRLNKFVKLLDGDNNVLKWVGIIVIGNLARADKHKKINKLVPRLAGFLREKSMITANNAIAALGKIAKSKPQSKRKIFAALLGVEKATYYNKGKISPECRNIALGKVIDVFSDFKNDVADKKEFIDFIKHQSKNTRPSTRKRAVGLLQKIT